MNTDNQNNTWGGQTYETPSLETIEIEIEGTVCVNSPNGDYDDNNLGDI